MPSRCFLEDAKTRLTQHKRAAEHMPNQLNIFMLKR